MRMQRDPPRRRARASPCRRTGHFGRRKTTGMPSLEINPACFTRHLWGTPLSGQSVGLRPRRYCVLPASCSARVSARSQPGLCARQRRHRWRRNSRPLPAVHPRINGVIDRSGRPAGTNDSTSITLGGRRCRYHRTHGMGTARTIQPAWAPSGTLPVLSRHLASHKSDRSS